MSSAEESWDDVDPEEILGIKAKIKTRKGQRKLNGKRILAPSTSSSDVVSPYQELLNLADCSVKNSGLTFEQTRAITMIACFGYTDEQVAIELNKTVRKIRSWHKNENFTNALASAQQSIHASALERRRQLNNKIVDELHTAILADIHSGVLARLSFKDKVRMLSDVSRESRLDDPTAATERTVEQHEHHILLEDIQKRYNVVQNRKRLQTKQTDQLNARNLKAMNDWQDEQISKVKVIDANFESDE